MFEELNDPQINNAIERCEEIGVILDYIILKDIDVSVTFETHRNAAFIGMSIIDKRLEDWAISRANEEITIDKFFRVKIYDKNISAKIISFREFWGSDDALPRMMSYGKCWAIPNIDGYKTAFFNPPHGLRGTFEEQIIRFNAINHLIFSPMNDENLEILQWPDDWSNYFDAGKEWWGTFFWTIYNKAKNIFMVLGGSTTD
jgi:hypothetical protein